ncbi:MAG: hypothetical protein IT379_16645 [Deltaproteobacteria bacterium]|nr:hypothetical protein [Deltaproteobacteria bacterium]
MIHGPTPLPAVVLATLALPAVVGCAAPSSAPSVPTAESCGSCHPAQLAEWRRSPHARGTSSPVFVALHERARVAWGASSADRCASCHAPEHAGEDGAVTCMSCHGAVGNRGAHDGLLVVDPELAPMGPTTLLAPTNEASTGAHAVRDGALLRSSQLCATCHELTGPRLFVETTASEHAASWASATGVECVDCHAPRVERRSAHDGPVRGVDHTFAGIDPAWGQAPEAQRDARDRAVALLDEALDLEVRRTASGDAIVAVANVGAGHSVPTGVAFLRDVWVDVEVALDGRVESRPRVIELGDRPVRAGAEVALITDADDVRHGALAAGEERTITVSAPSAARVRAVLRARAARSDALDALGLAARADEAPVLEVAESTSSAHP